MKLYLTILLISLHLTKGITQDGFAENHIEFLKNLELPDCIQLKYAKNSTELRNLPTKDISEFLPDASLSSAPRSETDRTAYIIMLAHKQYLHFGDSLFSSCIVLVESDSLGLTRLSTIGIYPPSDILHEISEICNKQILTLPQAIKIARPYWEDFKIQRKESILKYNISHDKFYWVLTGHRALDERTIRIDALSGVYVNKWDSMY